jgi:hypothetical protein
MVAPAFAGAMEQLPFPVIVIPAKAGMTMETIAALGHSPPLTPKQNARVIPRALCI